MAITYTLAPEPIWTLINNEGTVAGGAFLYTYRSLNKIQPKPVFLDAGGTEPWTNPIVFDLNGTQGPFYWQVDSANLADTYYLEAYDSNNNLLWTLDNFFPSGAGGGGGGTVTTFLPLVNYIANNQFIEHIPINAGPLPTNLVIAPSNHKGFTPALVNPIVGTYGVVGPDIRFVKNNTSATDNISFPLFTLGTQVLNGDVTPVEYIRYQCTAPGSGELYKAFQFPITQKVNNLSNQSMTFTLWGAVTATPINVNIYLRQYYGSGTGATVESASTRVLIGTCALTSSWTKFNIPFSVANVSGNSIGTPGAQTDDDAVYIQIEMPLNSASDVLFTKPSLYLGTINPSQIFENYDQINSIDSTPRTGDIRTSLTSAAPQGWLLMSDGTLGNVGSGATAAVGGSYQFQLYKTIWDSVLDINAPVIPPGRGASAVADFLAGKQLSLPLSLGRTVSAAGNGTGLTVRPLGSNAGSETHTLLAIELPPHTHTVIGATTNAVAGAGVTALGGISNTGPGPGASQPFSIIQPSSYYNLFIKL